MPDDITQRHLQRIRIRGAPATIPGSAGFVGSYDAEETWRQTGRALVLPLDRSFTAKTLRETFARLRAAAEAQNLTITEEPLFALKGDPDADPPHKWDYEALLPVRGNAKPDGDIQVTRVQGGMHIATVTSRGLPDLQNVYVFFFGKFMPSKKQQLMRPYVLHRVIAGLDDGHDDRLGIIVFGPGVLSITPVPVAGEGAEA